MKIAIHRHNQWKYEIGKLHNQLTYWFKHKPTKAWLKMEIDG